MAPGTLENHYRLQKTTMKTVRFLVLVGLMALSLQACNKSRYSVYDTQEYGIQIDLRDTASDVANKILDAYFLTYQYKRQENQRVYFTPCPVPERCQSHIYSMVWVWQENDGKQCSKGVEVHSQELAGAAARQYRFEPERVRCH